MHNMYNIFIFICTYTRIYIGRNQPAWLTYRHNMKSQCVFLGFKSWLPTSVAPLDAPCKLWEGKDPWKKEPYAEKNDIHIVGQVVQWNFRSTRILARLTSRQLSCDNT